MLTADELYQKLRREAEVRRRAMLAELAVLEEVWNFPRTVPPREERRHPSMTLTTDVLQKA